MCCIYLTPIACKGYMDTCNELGKCFTSLILSINAYICLKFKTLRKFKNLPKPGYPRFFCHDIPEENRLHHVLLRRCLVADLVIGCVKSGVSGGVSRSSSDS